MVLKKIIFVFLCYSVVSFGLGLELEPLWTRSLLGLDSPGLGLVLDSTRVDLTTAYLEVGQEVQLSMSCKYYITIKKQSNKHLDYTYSI